MNARIVFLLTLLALVQLIDGRHTIWAQLFDEPDETCSVTPEDRNDCGWYGIDQATCEGRGCCYDDTGSDDTIWCFYPTDNKCYGIDPQEREECGYSGIQREECENDNGCCFDHTVQNVPWCFKGTGPVTEAPTEPATEAPTLGETCRVEPEDRNDCGWYGIDRATCEGRGCCYDNTGSDDTIWCFYPTDNKCYGIDPQEREECGYYGIQREECENDNGCCFDHTVQNVPWCFKGTGPVTEAPTEPATEAPTLGETCRVEPDDRNDCGWYGIDRATCEGRGCCYDGTGSDDTIWCFYPTDNKCYGINPQEREECGYYGIQREECEDGGCCFDHTVQNVPWCFKGTEPVTEAPTEQATEAQTAGQETEAPETEEENEEVSAEA